MSSREAASDRDEHLSRLLDIAYELPETPPASLSDEERGELLRLRALLERIDAAWMATDDERDRVRALFLQQLAARNPAHPWVRRSTVRTLGELIASGSETIPALPQASYAQLIANETPVEALLDRRQRTAVVGRALQLAAVPSSSIGEFLLWFNRLVVALVPRPGPAGQGLLFARRQRPANRDDENDGAEGGA